MSNARLRTPAPRVQMARSSGPRFASVAPRDDSTPRQRGGAWTKRRAAYLRTHPLCVHCERVGMVTPADEVDHVVPLCEGGADNESNYQPLCVSCHKAKTAKEIAARAIAKRYAVG